ncbi:MAG: hypothetical protein ACR2QF_05590 [Geminicoccaceae bacterium]
MTTNQDLERRFLAVVNTIEEAGQLDEVIALLLARIAQRFNYKSTFPIAKAIIFARNSIDGKKILYGRASYGSIVVSAAIARGIASRNSTDICKRIYKLIEKKRVA